MNKFIKFLIEKLKKLFKRIINSKIIQTSFFNGIANVVRMLTGIVSNKIVSVLLGPSGMALMGQFSNFSSMVMSFATLGMSTGIIKYTAEYHDDENKRNKALSTSFILTISATFISIIFVLITSSYFTESLLYSSEYKIVFILFGLSLMFFTLNAYFQNILNGYKEFRIIVISNILTSVVGLIISIILVLFFGVIGALLSMIFSQSLIFFITLYFVVKTPWFKFKNFIYYFDKRMIIPLLKFSSMAFTSMFAITFIQLKIRNYIISNISIEDAGYWQGVLKVTNLYIDFITMTISIYVLPRLSEIKNSKELKAEIFKGYKLLIPLTVTLSLFIFIFKGFIINTLFSSSFKPMEPLFLFQLIGNIFKISAWLLGVLLWAKAMVITFIVIELVFGGINYFLTILFVSNYGVIGTTYAYSLEYFALFIVLIVIFYFYLRKSKRLELENNLNLEEIEY